MDFSQMIIIKHENVIKTFVNANNHSHINNRFSSGIIVVLKGKLIFEFENKKIFCDKEHPLFIPKGISYQFSCTEYAESLLFNFQTESDIREPSTLNNISQLVAKEYFDRIDSLSSKINPPVHMILMTYYEFFSRIFPLGINSDKSEEFVNEAEKIILRNFSDPKFNIEDIGKEINISNVYLRKLFAKHREMSPSKYLSKIRMEKAKIYLLETRSVSETAVSVGYSDIYQFSRAFKCHFGLSPTKYISASSVL